jgi:hypothetical protein
MSDLRLKTTALTVASVLALSGLAIGQGDAPPSPDARPGARGEDRKPEFPPFAEVAKDFVKVVSFSEEGREPLYTLYRRDKDQGLLAELPRNFANQNHFWAMTVAAGDTWAGLQGNEAVAYWKRYDKTLALVQPNFETRSTGDAESQAGVRNTFTDRVLLDVPILTMGPGGGPVIDLKALLAGQVGRFFGAQGAGANARLATIKSAKAFPENIEVSFQMPAGGGQLREFHYSISRLPENTGYKPREADERIGYFTTSYRDLGKFRDDKKWVRYINRWHVEKRDPSQRVSPPKEPIVFYVEHTAPVRYRRFIRDGVLEWNKAFEKIGIIDAIEVYYQDKTTGAHMDKDPEDVRYNFIRWLSNDMGTAIGPSRTDPRTGQILDADVVLTDGWIRYFWFQANELLPEVALQGVSAETLAWLERNPSWDPRLRLVDPMQRDLILAQRSQRGITRFGGRPGGAPLGPDGQPLHPLLAEDPGMAGLIGRTSQYNAHCMAARGKGMDMALMRMHLELSSLLDDPENPPAEGDKAEDPKAEDKKKDEKKGDEPAKPKKEQNLVDGIPDWFVGPLLADLTAHEVGHTLGLRHNFKASSIYPLSKINSFETKGEKPWGGSVMDYNPVNINKDSGPIQGEFAMKGIGPYDYWAIEYGYTTGDPKAVLKRVAEPELVYLTDEDVGGPDPLARQYDLSADPLDYANNQIRLVEYYRSRLLDKFVKDGESWAKARRGYLITLSQQLQAVSMMAPWVGGAHVNRDRKGDPNGRPPIEVVPVERQRAALRFVMQTAFRDESFGLTPEMLRFMTVDKWFDGGGIRDVFEDPTFPVHDRIIGVQATALTLIMNPTVLKRVYDNEFRVPASQDTLTLPELFTSVGDEIWKELDDTSGKAYDNRNPMISSLRRNLQREHLQRLIDLSMPQGLSGAAAKPVSNLATAQMRQIRSKIDKVIDVKNAGKKNADDYTFAHLSEAALRIDKVLDSQFIYNTDMIGSGGGGMIFMFGDEGQRPAPIDQRTLPPETEDHRP